MVDNCIPVQISRIYSRLIYKKKLQRTHTKIHLSCHGSECKLIFSRCLWETIELLQVQHTGNVTEAIFSYTCTEFLKKLQWP
jgi:hypothetical protein